MGSIGPIKISTEKEMWKNIWSGGWAWGNDWVGMHFLNECSYIASLELSLHFTTRKAV